MRRTTRSAILKCATSSISRSPPPFFFDFTRPRERTGPRDALRRRLEVQAERAVDGDPPEAEVFVVEDLRDLSFFEVAERLHDGRDVRHADFVTLVAERLAHLLEEVDRVDELHLALPARGLSVRDDPQVGRDACVVEELIRQGDDRFEPIVFDDPLPDLALARARVPGEERRAIEDDREAAPAFVDRLHLREHVLEEEERAVVDAREAGAEAPVHSFTLRFVFHELLHLLPFDAEGRVREQVIEAFSDELIFGEAVAPLHVVDVLAL